MRNRVRARKLAAPLILAAGVVLALATGLPGDAAAQINPFRGGTADRLNGQDVQMLTEANSKLLASPSLSTGSAEAWTNPASGASGSVRVNNTFQRQGMLCHTLGYHAQIRGGLAPRGTTLVWCRTHEGAWKIAS